MSRTALGAHASACREAVLLRYRLPRWEGGSLAGVRLTGADLTWVHLSGADLARATLTDADLSYATLTGATLTGVDLSGARLAEGVACGRAIGGESSGSRWWAVALEDGNVVLQCGLKRNLLRWWLTEGRRAVRLIANAREEARKAVAP